MANNRRRVLRGGALIGLAGSLILSSGSVSIADSDRDRGWGARAQNIILFIGDGMGQTHVDATGSATTAPLAGSTWKPCQRWVR